MKENKIEEIMQNYRKELKKIDDAYKTDEVMEEKSDISELDKKIEYEKSFIEKMKSEADNEENIKLINRAQERLNEALKEKKEKQEQNEEIDKNKERKENNIARLKNSKVVLPSGREVTQAEKDEIDRNSIKDETIRALTKESKIISEELIKKEQELNENRKKRQDFKYEFEKDKNGNSTGKVINESALDDIQKEFETIRKEMIELNKMQEDCKKYLEELKQKDKEKMENITKAWKEAKIDENRKNENITPKNKNDISNLGKKEDDETEKEEKNVTKKQEKDDKKEKPEIVVSRVVDVKEKENSFGLGKTDKIFKQNNEGKILKLQELYSETDAEKIKDIAKKLDPIVIEGVVGLTKNNIITVEQAKSSIEKLAAGKATKEDLDFKIKYDMKELSKGAFLPWNRKSRDKIASIAEEYRKSGIAEFVNGVEYEPNPIKRMFKRVNIKKLGIGKVKEKNDSKVSKISIENKEAFLKNIKDVEKNGYEKIIDDLNKCSNEKDINNLVDKAKNAMKNNEISKTELSGIINNVKVHKSRVEKQNKDNTLEISNDESKEK